MFQIITLPFKESRPPRDPPKSDHPSEKVPLHDSLEQVKEEEPYLISCPLQIDKRGILGYITDHDHDWYFENEQRIPLGALPLPM